MFIIYIHSFRIFVIKLAQKFVYSCILLFTRIVKVVKFYKTFIYSLNFHYIAKVGNNVHILLWEDSDTGSCCTRFVFSSFVCLWSRVVDKSIQEDRILWWHRVWRILPTNVHLPSLTNEYSRLLHPNVNMGYNQGDKLLKTMILVVQFQYESLDLNCCL